MVAAALLNENDNMNNDNDSLPGGPMTGSPNQGYDDDNDDAAALTPEQQQQEQQQNQQQRQRQELDPEDVMERVLNPGQQSNGGRRGRDVTGDQALMGASNEDGNVDGFEVTDESGEMVRTAVERFLEEYQQQVQVQKNDDEEEEEDVPMEDPQQEQQSRYVYMQPYHDQANAMSEILVRTLGLIDPDDDDDDDNDMSNQKKKKGSYSSTMFVNVRHLLEYDPDLADAIQSQFYRFQSFLRRAVKSFVLLRHPELQSKEDKIYFYLAMYNLPTHPRSVRQLKMEDVGTLCSVTATVTRTSDVRPELVSASFRCNKCGLLASNVPQQFHFTRPTICRNPRCKNASPMQFTLQVPESEFVDWQKLRAQENSDHIPPGSMPRSMDIILRNEMVERCKAGDKCIFTGTFVVLPDGSALARAGEAPVSKGNLRPSDAATGGGGGVKGLKALGVRELTYRTCFVATSVLPADSMQYSNRNEQVLASTLFGNATTSPGGPALMTDQDDPTIQQVAMEFTATQRADIRRMQTSPRLYEQMVDSICPNTFGHREVKKGILLMLLGGIHKTTPQDGIKLRGDVNVCIIGDPSTAKSQFLKYVHAFLPNRAVYTSGKASSAAGLTAAVQRDQDTGEYCIEAGALMLADNGICCIDEFDKMDPTDQVAIHEAMEQQTITITKAGIQATLNARASILAAANPIYGRYDRTKTLKANVALSAPILSRFDLFFVVLDDCNPESDRQVAQHILNVHRCQEDEQQQATRTPFSLDQMRRYIRFVRTINPKLTPESQQVLVDCYRKLRQGDSLGRSRSAYRITVRQLESMIRLSEALARLHCSDEVQPSYVREAYRLLRTSIIQVETSDVEIDDDDDDDDDHHNGSGGATAVAADADNNNNNNNNNNNDMEDTLESSPGLETQPIPNPGEYAGERRSPTKPPAAEASQDYLPTASSKTTEEPKEAAESPKKKKKKEKKKTKISFEEYQAITNAIAGHLRALEGEDVTDYLTWDEAMEWYLNQCLDDIGDSLERLEEIKKKVNLVIRRLIDVDRILVTVGEAPQSKKDQGKTSLAVHPNYEVS